MEDIEERAVDYAQSMYDQSGETFLAVVCEQAYKVGASEQKAIDIDKAIAWLSNYDNDYFPMVKKGWQAAFRKVMEE